MLGKCDMEIRGISHLTFSVSELNRSMLFYERVLGAQLLVRSEKTAYFDLNGLWIALNVKTGIPRREIRLSYTHIAFRVEAGDLPGWRERLREAGVECSAGRPRHPGEGESVYFADPDGHKFELHTGTREERIEYYRKNHPRYTFYE